MSAVCAGNLRWLRIGSFIMAVGCSSNGGDTGSAGDGDSTGLQMGSEPAGELESRTLERQRAAVSRHRPRTNPPEAPQAVRGHPLVRAAQLLLWAERRMLEGSTQRSSTARGSSGGSLNNTSRTTPSSTGGKAPGSVAPSGGAASGGKSAANTVSLGGATAGGKPASGGASSGGAANGGRPTTGGGAARGGASSSSSSSKGGASGGGVAPIELFIAGDSTVQNCSSDSLRLGKSVRRTLQRQRDGGQQRSRGTERSDLALRCQRQLHHGERRRVQAHIDQL